MSPTQNSSEAPQEQGPEHYKIRLKGHLDTRWADQFEGMIFIHESDGTTVLFGPVVDQSALYGLLRKVRDLGMPLLLVVLVEPDRVVASDVNKTQ